MTSTGDGGAHEAALLGVALAVVCACLAGNLLTIERTQSITEYILYFDIWRLANTPYGRLEIWDPFQNAPVPGDDENTAIGFNNCSDANIPNPGDNLRSAGAICTGCQNLPTTYRYSFIINNFF